MSNRLRVSDCTQIFCVSINFLTNSFNFSQLHTVKTSLVKTATGDRLLNIAVSNRLINDFLQNKGQCKKTDPVSLFFYIMLCMNVFYAVEQKYEVLRKKKKRFTFEPIGTVFYGNVRN